MDPPLSAAAQYMRQDMTREGYRHLLAVGAFGTPPAYLALLRQKVALELVQCCPCYQAIKLCLMGCTNGLLLDLHAPPFPYT